MFFIYLAFFLSIMNLTSIKILLPEIMVDLSVSLNWLTWVVNSYTLPVAILIPAAGSGGRGLSHLVKTIIKFFPISAKFFYHLVNRILQILNGIFRSFT